MQHEQGHQPGCGTRSIERRSSHERPPYCVSTCGWSALEPRHHQAPRTRRHRRYVGSGTLNVIVVFMELSVSHAACQRPVDVGACGKLWRCRAFDHCKAVAPRDAAGSEMPKVEQNCPEADKASARPAQKALRSTSLAPNWPSSGTSRPPLQWRATRRPLIL